MLNLLIHNFFHMRQQATDAIPLLVAINDIGGRLNPQNRQITASEKPGKVMLSTMEGRLYRWKWLLMIPYKKYYSVAEAEAYFRG